MANGFFVTFSAGVMNKKMTGLEHARCLDVK